MRPATQPSTVGAVLHRGSTDLRSPGASRWAFHERRRTSVHDETRRRRLQAAHKNRRAHLRASIGKVCRRLRREQGVKESRLEPQGNDFRDLRRIKKVSGGGGDCGLNHNDVIRGGVFDFVGSPLADALALASELPTSNLNRTLSAKRRLFWRSSRRRIIPGPQQDRECPPRRRVLFPPNA